ncbi:MAG: hypothetical protein HZC40_17455 [Chloroflexi bacterium]|nr:hypothetical protein [Chloroflexota bacterium]
MPDEFKSILTQIKSRESKPSPTELPEIPREEDTDGMNDRQEENDNGFSPESNSN